MHGCVTHSQMRSPGSPTALHAMCNNSKHAPQICHRFRSSVGMGVVHGAGVVMWGGHSNMLLVVVYIFGVLTRRVQGQPLLGGEGLRALYYPEGLGLIQPLPAA